MMEAQIEWWIMSFSMRVEREIPRLKPTFWRGFFPQR
jgi:hypothetical protein